MYFSRKLEIGIRGAIRGYPIEYIPGLREVDNGVLAGMKNSLADEKYPGSYWSALEYDACYPNGESPKMFYERVKTAWSKLKGERLARADKDALLVTHGGVIEAILCIENRIVFSSKAKRFPAAHAALIPIDLRPESTQNRKD